MQQRGSVPVNPWGVGALSTRSGCSQRLVTSFSGRLQIGTGMRDLTIFQSSVVFVVFFSLV